jgi:hypothetical protein
MGCCSRAFESPKVKEEPNCKRNKETLEIALLSNICGLIPAQGGDQACDTWIRREFRPFAPKVAENAAFVSKMFASVARFSQT